MCVCVCVCVRGDGDRRVCVVQISFISVHKKCHSFSEEGGGGVLRP